MRVCLMLVVAAMSSVAVTAAPTTKSTTAPVPTGKNTTVKAEYTYVGCFREISEPYKIKFNKKINGLLKKVVDGMERVPMKLEACRDSCRDVRLKYFGMVEAGGCACRRSLGRYYKRQPEGNCNISCYGDVTRRCGGRFDYSFYELTETPAPIRLFTKLEIENLPLSSGHDRRSN